MEFYKLFHKRTNWEALWLWQRKLIYPEYYEQKRIESEKRLERLLLPFSIIQRSIENSYYL